MTGPMLARDMGLSRRLLPVPPITAPGLLVGGAVGLLGVTALAVVGASLVPQHAAPAQPLLPPGALGHALGTDHLGRDVLARTLAGFSWSLAVVLPASAIAAVVGTALGLAATANRGWHRAFLERAAETAAGFPFLVLAVPLVAVAGRGYWPLLTVLAILSSTTFAWAAFEQTWGGRRPNPPGQVLGVVRTALPVVWAFMAADLVVAETSLSFLGAGAPEAAASWGNMLADARQYVGTAPWMLYTPAAALLLMVASANWLGEGLGQLWRPRPD